MTTISSSGKSSQAITHLDEEIIELYKAGFSLAEVSKMLYISPDTVRQRLIANNIKRRAIGGGHTQHHRLSHKELDRTIFLYRDCKLSLKRTAEILGINKSSVRGRLVRAGITMRGHDGK